MCALYRNVFVLITRSDTIRTVVCSKSFSNLSYKHQLGTKPLRDVTIGKLLARTAEAFPDTPALISKHQKKTVTFGQLLDSTDKLAAGLRRLGLQKGDMVGIWSPNCIEWETTMLACSRIGLIAVQLNPAYEADELKYCMNKVRVKCLVCSQKTSKHDFFGVLKAIDASIGSGSSQEINAENLPFLKHIVLISDNSERCTHNYQELLEESEAKETAAIHDYQDRIQLDDPSNIMFTSGSTGKPKAAVLSHSNLVNNSFSLAIRLQFDRTHQKILVQVPFFHTFGTTGAILGHLHFGSTLVLPGQYHNPSRNFDVLVEEKCNLIYGTPTMYVDLVSQQKLKGIKVQVDVAAVGGAPTTPKLIRDMYEALQLKHIVNFYGMTETTAVIFQSFLTDSEEQVANTVGHVADHAEVKVVDEENNVVPRGVPGELCTRGYMNMLEYYDNEEKTAEMIGKDNWLKTGDMFVLLEDGYGKIVGRFKDMIIRGGENVYPKEIEDLISSHPDVLECQVIGLPHERLGEEICACLRLKPGKNMTQEQLAGYCKKKIAQYKIPTKFFVMEDFPKTTSGKIQKFKLVEKVLKLTK